MELLIYIYIYILVSQWCYAILALEYATLGHLSQMGLKLGPKSCNFNLSTSYNLSITRFKTSEKYSFKIIGILYE